MGLYSFFSKLKNKFVTEIASIIRQAAFILLKDELENLKMLMAKNILLNQSNGEKVQNLQDAEFKVFSQWGDDGIIQYLIKNIEISSERFIEFGVENYLESNTRFLLKNNNWQGLVMDGSSENIEYIKKDAIYWKHSLTAVATFITKDNINQTIKDAGFEGNIGLLHIDIDGNDYWIWEAIDSIHPDIVIVEYNSLFGIDRPITIPYQADFVRSKAHHSNLYSGTSLAALYLLSQKKGYAFVGCNSAGKNAYFVKSEKAKNVQTLNLEEGYIISKFREAKGIDGNLVYLSAQRSLSLIKGLQVYNVLTNQMELI